MDLQAVFTTTYDRAGYDYSLYYRAAVQPPLTNDAAVWVAERLAALSEPKELSGPSPC